MLLPFAYKANWSRLTQPRGLKFLFHAIVSNLTPSRLTQPRGLKLLGKAQIKWTKPSRLTQPRGLKLSCPVTVSMRYWVEAYAASWIEMPLIRALIGIVIVETYAASWIEMPKVKSPFKLLPVETYAASWIGIWISNDISNLYTI